MNVLIIDDQPVPIETLRLSIQQEITGVTVSVHSDFDTAYDHIEATRPDAIVLDIYLDPLKEERPGDAIKDRVWEKHFCPIVIYTARPDAEHESFVQKHSLLKVETKGPAQSDARVIAHLKEFQPIVGALNGIRREVDKSLGNSLRDVCGVVWQDTADAHQRMDLVSRMAKRRVAAVMDSSATPQTPLRPWEQYIFPHLSDDLLTGDILRDTTAGNSAPGAFRVIVSPTCDLVTGRAGCLEQVLIAHCEPVEAFLKANGWELNTGEAKLRKDLPRRFTSDQVEGSFCLPELPNVIPMMTVNLKKLSLIDRTSIAPDQRYLRVASVDSPFRERIAWAYVQVAGRPGVPDLDTKAMAESFIQAKAANTGGGNHA